MEKRKDLYFEPGKAIGGVIPTEVKENKDIIEIEQLATNNNVSTYYDSASKDLFYGNKAALDVTFIENPNDAKLTAVLSVKNSFIKSRLKQSGGYDWERWIGHLNM